MTAPFRSAALALGALLIAACATDPSSVPERPDLVRTEIERQIDSGEPEAALARISALKRTDLFDERELAVLHERAVRSIAEALERALEEERPLEALRHRGNLEVLGVEPAGPTVSELYALAARSLLEDGNTAAALSVLLRAPELSSLPVEALDRAAHAAKELNNRYALGLLAEILGPVWRQANPELMAFAVQVPSPLEMTDGVVTVWVNRGLRIERGFGVPDRVIGSGFFIDPRGYLLTNYHVIASEVDPRYEGYSRLYVRLPEDPAVRVPARVVGYSRAFDVALVKVEFDAPYVFGLTSIRSLEPGRRIIAIGSPGGLESSISSGIVSAVGRRFLQMGDAFQVDVPVNPGSSGGPLLDERGRVVGIVFAGIQQFEGVNFGIAAHWLERFLPALYTPGPVVHPWIGVSVEPVSGGLEVSYVARQSPAEAAGIRAGDLITGLGSWPVERVGPAQAIVLDRSAGSLLPVAWLRDGEPFDGLVVLGPRPESPVEVALRKDLPDRLYPVLFGMHVERTGSLSLRQSYQVTRVYRGSLADETGISPGDTFIEREFRFDDRAQAVFLRMFIQKRTQGFMQTSIQLPAYVERDNFL